MAFRWSRYDREVCIGRTNSIRTMLPIVFLKSNLTQEDHLGVKDTLLRLWGDSGESIVGTTRRVTLFIPNHFPLEFSSRSFFEEA